MLARFTLRCLNQRILIKIRGCQPLVMRQQHGDVSKSNYCQVLTDNDVAILKMNRAPANGLNLDLLTQLDKSLENLENDPNTRGLIITSTLPKIFTAGLDLHELYNPKKDRFNEFWTALQNFWMRLYMSPLATVACINGHSPAGGCLIAMSCDARIMASGKYTIGLNETLLNMIPPFWFVDIMANTIGHRQAEKALQLGTLFTPDEALRIGLVDQLADEATILDSAKQTVTKWLKIPDHARQTTKTLTRRQTVDKLANRRDQDVEMVFEYLNRDSIQKSIGRYLESLKKNK
jgi:3,2-trans-enoyl-CoA isomerase